MKNSKKIREPTNIEKEREKIPNCPFDILNISTCIKPIVAENFQKCRTCLIVSIEDSIDDDKKAETIRHVLSLENLYKQEYLGTKDEK
jgi:hypothetical protein